MDLDHLVPLFPRKRCRFRLMPCRSPLCHNEFGHYRWVKQVASGLLLASRPMGFHVVMHLLLVRDLRRSRKLGARDPTAESTGLGLVVGHPDELGDYPLNLLIAFHEPSPISALRAFMIPPCGCFISSSNRSADSWGRRRSASPSRCLAGLGRDGRRRKRLRPGRPVGVAVVVGRAPGGLGALVGHPPRRLVAAPMGRPIVEVAARPGHLTASSQGNEPDRRLSA